MKIFFLMVMAAAYLVGPARATTVSRLYDFETGTKIQADQVNAELNNLVDALNGTLDGQSNIAQNAIATGNIASAAVTKSKLGPLGQQTSSPPPFAQNSSTQEAAVANLTANITVDHRPVWVGLQPSGGSSLPGRVSYQGGGGGSTGNTAYISFRRDFATANQAAIGARDTSSSTNKVFLSLPCSSFWFVDTPDSGPHNYAAFFRTATADSGVITVENCKLVVFEL